MRFSVNRLCCCVFLRQSACRGCRRPSGEVRGVCCVKMVAHPGGLILLTQRRHALTMACSSPSCFPGQNAVVQTRRKQKLILTCIGFALSRCCHGRCICGAAARTFFFSARWWRRVSGLRRAGSLAPSLARSDRRPIHVPEGQAVYIAFRHFPRARAAMAFGRRNSCQLRRVRHVAPSPSCCALARRCGQARPGRVFRTGVLAALILLDLAGQGRRGWGLGLPRRSGVACPFRSRNYGDVALRADR